jgi:hypothetical protein
MYGFYFMLHGKAGENQENPGKYSNTKFSKMVSEKKPQATNLLR